MYTKEKIRKEEESANETSIFQKRMERKRRIKGMGYTKRRYKSKRQRQKQKLLLTKSLLLLLFIGCIAGIVLFAWNILGLGTKEPVGPIVCIDPGHGGADVGAVGPDDRYEKDDNLTLALAVQKELEEKGVAVLMTREDDRKLSLEDRCYIANKEKATLFVSIHRNSAERKSANGIEIWTANNGTGNQMATYIYEGLKMVGMQTDRGIQRGTSDSGNSDYYVNKHTNMPSCLLEMGFITNEEDNRLLDVHMEEYAKAIAEGIEKMLLEMEAEEAQKDS